MTSSFQKTIEEFETILGNVYDFKPHSSLYDFLLLEDELESYPELHINKTYPQVLLQKSNGITTEYFFTFYCPQHLFRNIESRNPHKFLSSYNLNASLALIEEISHFHLLANRIIEGRITCKLELEWQAEIDKILVAAILLRRQSGKSHYLALTKILFEQSVFHSTQPHYMEATKYAARFWYDLLSHQDGIFDPENSKKLHTILKKLYRQNWAGKFKNICNNMYLKTS